MADQGYLRTPEQWTRFLSAFTHELRTPLASLRMLGELLATAPTPRNDQEKRYIENIQEVVQDLQTMVGDAAELSRLMAGRVQVREVGMALETLVDQVKEAVRPWAWERGIVLSESLDPALPRLVRGDPEHLRHMLVLLLGTTVSQAESEVYFRFDLDDDRLRIVVSSDGPPFPEEAIPTLFTPFDQGARTARRRGGGSLSLPLVNELARTLGGTLRACNRGERPTFELSLPLAAA